MTEETKPIELEDDALEAVSGGVSFIWNEMHPRDYGASCQTYKVSKVRQDMPKSCYSCWWFVSQTNDNPSNPKWKCQMRLDPPAN